MWLVILRENRFKLLFGMMMVFFLVVPTLMETCRLFDTEVSRWTILVISAVLLFTATYSVSGRRHVPYFLIGLMCCSLVVELVSAILPWTTVSILHHVMRIAYFGFLIIVILSIVFNPKKVTYDTISASLCIYLLIGVLWANLYAICEVLQPGSITVTSRQDGNGNLSIDDMTHSFRMLYFSLVTLSTVGYGDAVPRTPLTRMLAVSEAIIGQIYLLVMVSRLVGIHVAQALAPLSCPGEQPSKAGEQP